MNKLEKYIANYLSENDKINLLAAEKAGSLYATIKGRLIHFYSAKNGKLACLQANVPKNSPWMGSNDENDAKYSLALILIGAAPNKRWSELKVEVL